MKQKRTVLIGHSMGSLTATRMALKSDPASTQLVLISPVLVTSDPKPPSTSSSGDDRSRAGSAAGSTSLLSIGTMARVLSQIAGPVRLCKKALRGMSVSLSLFFLRCLAALLPLPLHRAVYSPSFWKKGLSASVHDSAASLDTPFLERYTWPSRAKDWDVGMANFVVTTLFHAIGAKGGNPSLVDQLRSHVSEGLDVLIVHGASDAIVPPVVSHNLHRALSGARERKGQKEGQEEGQEVATAKGKVRLVEMEASGHLPHEEEPEVFLGALSDFFGWTDHEDSPTFVVG